MSEEKSERPNFEVNTFFKIQCIPKKYPHEAQILKIFK